MLTVQHHIAGHDPTAADADLHAEAAARVLENYQRRTHGRSQSDEAALRIRQCDLIERELRLAALRAKRNAIYALARTHYRMRLRAASCARSTCSRNATADQG